ncbi:MAG: GGDEF domain-containing protein [Spirochaetales bacterium]|nr:GGDEF domain-containing protein [Spirochaetales bacterium]
MLTQILRVDIGIYALLILLIILYGIRIRHRGYESSVNFLRFVCWSAVFVILMDIMPWLCEGRPGRNMERLNYLSNFLLLSLSSLPLIGWVSYLDFIIYRSRERLRKRLYYLPYTLIALAAMAVTPATGFVFSIMEGNIYQRGPGIAVIAAVNYLLVLQAFFIVVRQKRGVDRPVWLNLLIFGLVPTIGATLQMRFYGLMTTWPFTVLAILMTYLFLEVQRETRDYLTGLLNRRQIEECLQIRLGEAGRSGSFALIIIDMDDFKIINDTLGHQTGDQALIAFSNILVRSLKRTDRVGRLGGDEFMIILETKDEDVVFQVTDRISGQTEKENTWGNNPFRLDFSFGYAFYHPSQSYKELMHQADQMMYRKKRERRKTRPPS